MGIFLFKEWCFWVKSSHFQGRRWTFFLGGAGCIFFKKIHPALWWAFAHIFTNFPDLTTPSVRVLTCQK
jgi:hypothetical protein